MKWLGIHFHSWGKWNTVYASVYLVKQNRTCDECGKVQAKDVWYR